MQKLRRLIEMIRRIDANVQRHHVEIAELREQLAETTRVSMTAARRSGLRRSATRVLVLVHNETVWSSLDELVRLMDAAPDFDPVVVSIPHHYAGLGPGHGESEVHEMLDEAGVPHLRLTEETMASASTLIRALDPDLVIRQSQWDADVDAAFNADALGGARAVHIPYGTMNMIQNAPWGDPPVNSGVDTDWHRFCWLVFVANDVALSIARRDSLTGGRQFRAVGHPKADSLRRIEPFWPIAEREGPRRTRIAWSAHHSILSGWNDFGMFPSMYRDMLDWATAALDLEFAYFHHPLLPQTIARPQSPITAADYDDWLAAWTALPNTAYWTGHYAAALAAADVVVTDGPSVLTESQVLDKPVLFVERPDHTPFNEAGKILAEGVHRLGSVGEVRAEFAALQAAGADPLAQTQRRNVERLFGAPGAAARILDVLRDEIAAERGAAAE